jgi:hypothetical protein
MSKRRLNVPNWCTNTMVVLGEPERITALLEAVKSEQEVDGVIEPLSFERILPTPPSLLADETEAASASGEMPGWYEWRIEHWGTKWEVFGCDLEDQRALGRCVFSFETAWAPPEPVIEHLSRRFPDLHFGVTCIEPINGLGSAAGFEGGERRCTIDYNFGFRGYPGDCKELLSGAWSVHHCAIAALESLGRLLQAVRKWVPATPEELAAMSDELEGDAL